MSNHTTITVSWNDDRGETHNERFFNVVALGNFLKENPRLANELLYLPKKPGSVARTGKGKRFT